MMTDLSVLKARVADLEAENLRLRAESAALKAARADLARYLDKLLPPFLPTEDELREMMKDMVVVPVEEILKDLHSRKHPELVERA